MSETCIVCLGDLGGGVSDPTAAPAPSSSSVLQEDAKHASSKTVVDVADDDVIAHLLPCGHNLHNECLKPWVQRANSCPICRQNFNLVELTQTVGGNVISTYHVDDKVQQAEIDPTMLVEELDDDYDETVPCPECGRDEDEDLMLLCDGCDTAYHTYCVGLDSIPMGHWFCDNCEEQRQREVFNFRSSSSHNPPGRRTRAQRRHPRNRDQMNESNWARVWQSVYDHTRIDLDFPYGEESESSTEPAPSQLCDATTWERRFQVAERQGAANRFRNAASALFDLRAARSVPEPEPESQEVVMAWNAFEKAREIEDQAGPSRGRKRKTPPSSPSDVQPAPQPERKLKRPRTRHIPGPAESCVDAEPQTKKKSESQPSSSSNRHLTIDTANTQPSFLQSLLKEVEGSAAPDEMPFRSAISADHSSPRPSSPVSPSPSGRSSPRALSRSPPPFSATPRTGSPLSLSSKVEPIFPRLQYPPLHHSTNNAHVSSIPELSLNQMSIETPSRPRAPSPPDAYSPTRPPMSLSAKSHVQGMVSTALKPLYHAHDISKDEYTDINRTVSRMLYERIGDDVVSMTEDAKQNWQRIANEEVEKAFHALKKADPSDSSGERVDGSACADTKAHASSASAPPAAA